MGAYNFTTDLRVAKGTEADVLALFEKHYDAKALERNDTNAYDLRLEIPPYVEFDGFTDGAPRQVTVEVKSDFMSWKTGNIAVEFSCRDKPSGIEVTQANYYVYVVNFPDRRDYILHTTDAVKKMIADLRYFRVVNGGDKGSNSMNYLFKRDVFLSTGRLLPEGTK